MLLPPDVAKLGVLSILISSCLALPWASTAISTLGRQDATVGLHPSLSHTNVTTSVGAPPFHSVECFDTGEFVLEVAAAADCELLINEFILRLSDPMRVQTFGFDETADVDLSLPDNSKWHYGQCLISLSSTRHTEVDRFRPVDIAMVAQMIVSKCVVGSKRALGGHAFIGAHEKHFYVIVGGTRPLPTSAIDRPSRASSNVTNELNTPEEHIDIEDLKLSALSHNITNTIAGYSSSLPIVCTRPGMPAVGNINPNDCLAAAEALLDLPDILIPRNFTTEQTGGVHVPDVHQSKTCFLTINSRSTISKSDTFSYVKVAYFALEVMRKCPFGGVVKLTPGENGFYMSLTGVNPVFKEIGLNDLSRDIRSDLAIGGNLSSQPVGLETS